MVSGNESDVDCGGDCAKMREPAGGGSHFTVSPDLHDIGQRLGLLSPQKRWTYFASLGEVQ